MSTNITYFDSFDGSAKEESLINVFNYMQNDPQYKTKCDGIAYMFKENPKHYASVKKTLKAVTWNARFQYTRKTFNITGLTGFCYLDMDLKTNDDYNIKGVQQLMMCQPYVMAAYISASRRGLGIVCAYDAKFEVNPDNFKFIYKTLAEKICKDTDVNIGYIDPKCCDINRLAFIPSQMGLYDTEMYKNEGEYTPLVITQEDVAKHDIKKIYEKRSKLHNFEPSMDFGVRTFTRYFDAMFDTFQSKYGQFGEGNRHNIILDMALYSLHRNIPKESLIKYVCDNLDYNFLESKHQIEYVYHNYYDPNEKFPILHLNIKEGDNLTNHKDSIINAINRNKTKKGILLNAPTGSGKSHFFAKLEKTIIVVPSQSLARQLAKEHDMELLMDGHPLKNLTMWKNIVTTYNSFPQLYTHKFHKAKFTVVFDESHTILSDAHPDFKGQMLHNIFGNPKELECFKKYIFVTGTNIPTVFPLMNDADLIRIDYDNPTVRKWSLVKYDSKIDSILKNKKNGLNIVYLNNKEECEVFSTYATINGYYSTVISADHKDTQVYKDMIDGFLDPALDFVFTTSIMKEGLNIYNDNVSRLHICSLATEYDIQQIAGRFRNSKGLDMVYYSSNNTNCFNLNSFNLKSYQDDMIGQLVILELITEVDLKEIRAMIYGIGKKAYDKDSRVIFKKKSEYQAAYDSLMHHLSKEQERCVYGIIQNKMTYHIDYLGLANLALEKYAIAIKSNIHLLEIGLSQFGWEYTGHTVDTLEDNKLESKLKDIRKQFSDEINETLDAYINSDLLMFADTKDMNSFMKSFKSYNRMDRIKNDVNKNMVSLASRFTFDSAKDAIKTVKHDTRKMNTINKMADIQTVRNYEKENHGEAVLGIVENTFASIINDVYKHFNVGESYDNFRIHGLLNAILAKNGLPCVSMTKAKQLFNLYFSIKETRMRKEGKVLRLYTIISDNPLGELKLLPKKDFTLTYDTAMAVNTDCTP